MEADPKLKCTHAVIMPDLSAVAGEYFLGVCVGCDCILERVWVRDYIPMGAVPSHWIATWALDLLGVEPNRMRMAQQMLMNFLNNEEEPGT